MLQCSWVLVFNAWIRRGPAQWDQLTAATHTLIATPDSPNRQDKMGSARILRETMI